MNESIEFDIKVNGRPAQSSINDVEKAQRDLEGTVDKTSKNIKANWTAIGAAVGAASVAIGALMKSSVDIERATFGLTQQTKEYIKAASEQYGMSQEVIAGFVQTGKAAGMSGDEIKKMIDQAVALGRAFPHESTESFIDNLTQLNRTGEAQGYIVDILEQKYGLLDQKLLSSEQKMAAVEEATKGVNEEFDKTRAANMDKTFEEVKNSTIDLGNALWDIADSTGAIWAVEKGFLAIQLAALGYQKVVSAIKAKGGSFLGFDMSEEEQNLARIEGRIDDVFKKIATGGQSRTSGTGSKIGTPDIAGAAKASSPFSPQITEKWLNDQVNANKKMLDEQKRAAAEREREAKKAGDRLAAEKERQLQEAIAINEQFMDDYNASVMNGYEYELSLLDRQYAEYQKHVKDKAKLDEWYNSERLRLAEQYDEQMQAYAAMGDALVGGLTRGIVDFAEKGKANFKDMANSIIQDLLRIQIQASMMQLFGNFGSGGGGLLGGLFDSVFAKGAAFNNGQVTAFASGGVVNSPTLFPMANGTGLMGEAGPEAIVPLKRTKGGDLGVKAASPVVNVNVQNYGNDQVSVNQNGNDIQVVISQIASSIQRGTGDIGAAIEGRYGLRKK